MVGFSVRKKLKRKNKSGVVNCRSWLCSSEGFRDEKVHHTHALAKSHEKPFVRSNRKLTELVREVALLMKRAGIKTSHIWQYLVEIYGGWEKVGCIKADLYRGLRNNFRNWDDCDTTTAMVKILFLCGNRYGKPLVILLGYNNHNRTCVFGFCLLQNEKWENYKWLLKTFLECMEGKMPKTVLTDGCLSMKKALNKVMPETVHRICSWHLLKNAIFHIHKTGFTKEFKKLIFRYIFAGSFFRWARATGICESMNAFIKKDLEKGLPLWMFLRHCDNGVAALRYNEMAENYKTNMTDPCPKLTSMPNIEEQAASIFTRKVFNLVKAEIKRGDKYSCSKSEILPNYDLFLVSKYMSNHPKRKTSDVIAIGLRLKEYHVDTFLHHEALKQSKMKELIKPRLCKTCKCAGHNSRSCPYKQDDGEESSKGQKS
ncbi:hypothetical protein F8388_018419 [Cannabis sativa]|uniref:MULE transposase domain-containing protein n=1 Tax=Cannabis sativa TaxID=3483 RepID=A0A7J6DWS8_CANSA|nr:hypothetical protein F8388_018419 [Cannabis sativa]